MYEEEDRRKKKNGGEERKLKVKKWLKLEAEGEADGEEIEDGR